MKKIKRMMAIAIAIALSVATCGAFTAFADPEAKAADLADHTYTAYQIFSGTQSDDETEGKLGNIQWGTAITDNGAALITELKKISALSGLASNASAQAVADAISALNYNDYSDDAKAIAKAIDNALASGAEGTAVTDGTGLEAGYYLIKDTTANLKGTDTARNLSLLQMTKKGKFEIRNKTDVPEVEKKVIDKNDSTPETSGWQDSADYDVNDAISYKLTGTLPTNYADYDWYRYVFTDTASKGLTIDTSSVAVHLDSETGTDITSMFTIAVSDYSGDDAKYTGGQVLTVTANAGTNGTYLKENASITSESKIVVTYTATLNEDAVIGVNGNPNKVDLTYSNNPNKGGEGDTGKTPEDVNIVFTYKLVVDKIDGTSKDALKGAGFTLYKKNGSSSAEDKYEAVGSEVIGTDMTQFAWNRLDDGDYRLVETTTPSGYNTIAPIEFTVTANHDITAASPTLTSITVTDGKGLTASLAGGTITKQKGTHTADSGEIFGEVENNKGATLPETGGSGTTMIYIIGVILLAGAGILLVTRRRMKAE